MEPRDWTLMVISVARGPLEPVQLQKVLFLLSKNLSLAQLQVENFYTFEPYDYGPFCSVIYSDAEQLEEMGLVAIQRPPEARFKRYRVTEAGANRAGELLQRLQEPVREYVTKLVAFAQSLSFNQLVELIYQRYPDMRANSVFQEKV